MAGARRGHVVPFPANRRAAPAGARLWQPELATAPLESARRPPAAARKRPRELPAVAWTLAAAAVGAVVFVAMLARFVFPFWI